VGANAPTNILPKTGFFWLLSKRGANKKSEIFSELLFGWRKDRTNENPTSHCKWNRGMVDSLHQYH